jgi:hypothetical protein
MTIVVATASSSPSTERPLNCSSDDTVMTEVSIVANDDTYFDTTTTTTTTTRTSSTTSKSTMLRNDHTNTALQKTTSSSSPTTLYEHQKKQKVGHDDNPNFHERPYIDTPDDNSLNHTNDPIKMTSTNDFSYDHHHHHRRPKQHHHHHEPTESTATAKVFIELTDKIELDIPLDMWNNYDRVHKRQLHYHDEMKEEEFHVKDRNTDDDALLRDMILDYIWQHYSEPLKKSFQIKPCHERTTVNKQNHHLQLFDQCTKLQTQFLLKEEVRILDYLTIIFCTKMKRENSSNGSHSLLLPPPQQNIYISIHSQKLYLEIY